MVDYRSILRLHSQGNSQREIEREINSSRHTISEVLLRAKAANIAWPLDDDVTNEEIQNVLFPGKHTLTSPYAEPDYTSVHSELAKKGVTSRSFGTSIAGWFGQLAVYLTCTRSSAKSTGAGRVSQRQL